MIHHNEYSLAVAKNIEFIGLKILNACINLIYFVFCLEHPHRIQGYLLILTAVCFQTSA